MEAVLLGGLIVGLAREPGAVEAAVATLEPQHFHSAADRLVFEAIVALRQSGTPVDLVSIYEQLRATDHNRQVGATYLAFLWTDACLPNEAPLIARLFRSPHPLVPRPLNFE